MGDHMVAYDECGIDADGTSLVKALGFKEKGTKGDSFVLCCLSVSLLSASCCLLPAA